MAHISIPKRKIQSSTFDKYITPLLRSLPLAPELVSIDGSLIDAVLSMHWADYRKGSKKAKAHCGFNINSSKMNALCGAFSVIHFDFSCFNMLIYEIP